MFFLRGWGGGSAEFSNHMVLRRPRSSNHEAWCAKGVGEFQTLKPIAAQLRSRLQADVSEDDHTWREKMERAVLNIPLTVTGRLSQPVVSMYKLINMQIGDTFPIAIGEGVEVQIDGEDAFCGELGEVGASAAINLKSRLK